MDMEITFDPREHAIGMGIMIGENHELLPDGEWVSWCKRISGIKDLFLYRHREVGSFVLAKWIYNPKKDGIGIAMELEVMSDHPDKYPHDLPSPHNMRNRLKPAGDMAEQMKKSIRDRAKAKRQALIDGQEKKEDVAGWLDRQGKEGVAEMVRKRKYQVDESDEFEDFKKDLQNKAKGRIITGGK
tara:strand:+ start:746 stop:1300 length:555 start_codon:yes stop_codon:yes gene_type:complete